MSKRISQLTAASLDGAELIEVSKLSATVTKTASTISAQASDNSFNDSGAGFVIAGFTVGKSIKVVGFTGNAVNNIFSAVITAVTAGKITIGGTDGDVIVDDAAGESVTITQWDSVRTTSQAIADLNGGPHTYTYAETLSIDLDVSTVADVTLTGNPTINFTGGADGDKIMLRLKQDAAGSRTVTWGTMVRFGTDVVSPTLTTTANKTDVIGLVYNAAASKYDVVAVAKGY